MIGGLAREAAKQPAICAKHPCAKVKNCGSFRRFHRPWDRPIWFTVCMLNTSHLHHDNILEQKCLWMIVVYIATHLRRRQHYILSNWRKSMVGTL